ncbi:MAG: NAD(P) transhydrogenase subunit alpha [Planctomycetota bacterium]
MPNVFIPAEVRKGETRVAAVPETVQRMGRDGFAVTIQTGAGARAFLPDATLAKAGATIAADPRGAHAAADIVLRLHPPSLDEAALLREGSLLVTHLWPYSNKELCARLMARRVTVFAMDQIPRTPKAQYMDSLSSQMSLAGYKAVLMAAERVPITLPLMMTAAGTINPAKVVVMGAGVAGLQAIATAKRLGAAVEATDVRPEVKEQVHSLGAKFIEPPGAAVGEGGYAAAQSAEFLHQQQETVRKHLIAADIVITTAKVPGRQAPILVTRDVVQAMRPGAVIVDLAAEEGGNCECTRCDEIVVERGVTIIGVANIPGTVPVVASAVYAKNVYNVLKHLHPKSTSLALDFADEITDGAVILHAGGCRSPRIREAHGFPAPH